MAVTGPAATSMAPAGKGLAETPGNAFYDVAQQHLADLAQASPQGYAIKTQLQDLYRQAGPNPTAQQQQQINVLQGQLESMGLTHHISHDFGDTVSDTIGDVVGYGVPALVIAANAYAAAGALGGAAGGAAAGGGEAAGGSAAASDLGTLGATSEGVSGGAGAVGAGAATGYDPATGAFTNDMIGGGDAVWSGGGSGSSGPLEGGAGGFSDSSGGSGSRSSVAAPTSDPFGGMVPDWGTTGFTEPSGGAFGSAGNFLSGLSIKDDLVLGSGLYGIYSAEEQRRLAKKAAAMQDPFGPQRAQYQKQLADLNANPNSVTSLPGYKFGMDQGTQALLRSSAATGYTGSGNEGIALQKFGQNYAGDFLRQQQQYLASLAGAGIAPSGGNTLIQGNAMANDSMSRALATLGYGFGGRYGNMTNAQLFS